MTSSVTAAVCIWLCVLCASAASQHRLTLRSAGAPAARISPRITEFSPLRNIEQQSILADSDISPRTAKVSPRTVNGSPRTANGSPRTGPRERSSLVTLDSEATVRSSQGPEGFAYEVSHPVLDAYGKLHTATQYHGQDGLGRYRYSYKHPGTEREEYVDENGRIQGSYSYRSDDEDKVSMTYMADDTGFHVLRANLPPLASRAPRDDPLVAAIKAAHMQLWRRMWLKAAMASLGQAVTEEQLNEMMPAVAPPVAEVEVNQPESLESDLVEGSHAPEVRPDPAPSPEAPAPPEEPLVPLFPGAPGAPATPVGSAPKPLPASTSGIESPDEETIIIGARFEENGNAPGGGRGYDEFEFQPVGALRYRDSSLVISGPGPTANDFAQMGLDEKEAELLSTVVNTDHESVLIEGRTPQLRTQILADTGSRSRSGEKRNQDHLTRTALRSTGFYRRPLDAQRRSRRPDSLSPSTRRLPVSRGVELRSKNQARLRVSDEAARAGAVPVAARHDRAQLRPVHRHLQPVAGPVLEEPLLYYYSSLLHAPPRRDNVPEIVVV